MIDKKKLKSLKDRAARLKSQIDAPKGIPCKLLKQTQFGSVVPSWEGPKKSGSYHGSVWHEVSGFGVSKWVVGCYVIVDYEKYRADGLTDDEIVRGCVEFLNCPPKRKKYAKRTPKPLYGTLDDMPVRHQFKEKNGEKCIMMMLVTDQRKNRNFFGEGQNYVTKRTRKKKKA
tara:strand:- start:594 stop:1109 length:516 start_codon:yes stop_codon:yes gene_type:complete